MKTITNPLIQNPLIQLVKDLADLNLDGKQIAAVLQRTHEALTEAIDSLPAPACKLPHARIRRTKALAEKATPTSAAAKRGPGRPRKPRLVASQVLPANGSSTDGAVTS